MINHGKEDFKVNQGDRIAQLIIEKYESVEWEEVEELSESQRGEGGYGHTGV
ncbi:dUTPase-like protein [Orenia metallireducens]|uniref:dUTP diphosphatase n=1 Tax=Orenia metallireducens TaxID=1413210 RepID=A0A285FNA1_9FIRM|nr:dUTPase-like protein [Orenia metallireducens]SNY11796.1 dUTPase [Orenia metallireducens]